MATLTPEQQEQKAKFPWESPYPTGPFWDTLGDHYHHLGRGFQLVFPPEEITKMDLDHSLSEKAKWQLLHSIVEARVEESPILRSSTASSLSHQDYQDWSACNHLLASLDQKVGDVDTAEQRYRTMISVWAQRVPSDPEMKSKADLGSISNLAFFLVQGGRLSDAEPLARELLPLLREHPSLGPASPQALGTMRLLMEILAKQGKYDDAEKLNVEGYCMIEELAKSKFSMYEQEEIDAMDEMKENLEKWRIAAAARG